jgi:hypothetical protein
LIRRDGRQGSGPGERLTINTGRDKPKEISQAMAELLWNGIGGKQDELKRGNGGVKSIQCFAKSVSDEKIMLE